MISVIIPVYNGEPYIDSCVRSVMEQTYRELEVIIIDDGSSDRTQEICNQLALQDSRIRIVKQANAGVSSARNVGLSLARGEFVLFVDADDQLPFQAAQTLLDAAGPDVDLVIGGHEAFRGDRKKVITPQACRLSLEELVNSFEQVAAFLHTPWGKLFRRSVIAAQNVQFDASMPYGEDTKFNLDYCKHVCNISMITDTVYSYRLGGYAGSVRYYPNRAELSRAILDAYFDFFKYNHMLPLGFMKRCISSELKWGVVHHVVNVDFKTSCERTGQLLDTLSPYLTEKYVDRDNYTARMICCIHEKNGKGLVKEILRTYWSPILKKKGKKLYCRVIGKRI